MDSALSMKQAIALSEAWHALSHNTIFVVTHGREFLVEAPEERQDRDDSDDLPVLRLWTEHEDAWLYCEEQQENYGCESHEMHVMGVNLAELYKLKGAINNNGIAEFGVGVRVDVCTLRNGEPVVLDTLWHPEQSTH